jgi:xylulokinase
MKDLLLAIDIGTSRVKVALFGGDGRIIALGSETTHTISPRPDWAEQDPIKWWLSTVRIIRAILKVHPGQRGAIRAVAVTGQMHGPVLLDIKGRPIGNCITWQDRRAQKETEEIARKVPEQILYRLSGYRLSPYMTAPKLLWIRKRNRKHYLKAHRIVLPKDFVRSRLTGDFYTDWTDANGTGLFDMRNRSWAGETFRELGLDVAKMPEIKPPFEVVGEIDESASRKTGLDTGVPVVAGGGDDVVAIGTGAVGFDSMTVNLGTSCSTYVNVERPILDSEMRLECFVGLEEGKWLLSGTTTSAGASVDWITKNAGLGGPSKKNLGSYAFLDNLSKWNIRPSGLLFLPYLAGERTPIWDANATGALLGITLRHTRQDLMQSVLEGVGFTIRSILDLTEQLTGRRIHNVHLAGAATSSHAWMRILAGILGRRVIVPKQSEATALGAAILGAVGTKLAPSLKEASTMLVGAGHVFTPRGETVRAYEAMYELYARASRACIERPSR